MDEGPVIDVPGDSPSRFSAHLMYVAAAMYYLEDINQANIAKRLGTSRTTVSRLLQEARRQNIVHIEVRQPRNRSRTIWATGWPPRSDWTPRTFHSLRWVH